MGLLHDLYKHGPSGLMFSKVAEKLENLPGRLDVIIQRAMDVVLGNMSPKSTVREVDMG